MRQLSDFYILAENEGILTTYFSLRSYDSIIAVDNGSVCIGINPKNISENVEKYLLVHELGHYFTGTYYTQNTIGFSKGKAEYEADYWMANQLVPPEEMSNAIKEGKTNVWELADYFNVPISVIERATEIYKMKGLL